MVLRGGVHEIFPVLILAALGVAFAFVALDYMTSAWGNVKPRSTEFLHAGVDSFYVRCGDGSGRLVLQLFNRGMHDIRLYRFELVGYGWWVPSGYRLLGYRPDPGVVCGLELVEAGSGGVVLRHGFEGWLVLYVPPGVAGRVGPGASFVKVKLYSSMGVLFIAYVRVVG